MANAYQWRDYAKLTWKNGRWVPKGSDDSGDGKAKARENKMQRQKRLKNKYRNGFGGAPFQKWDYETRSYYWAGGVWDKKRRRWVEAAKNWEPTAPLYFAYGSNLNVEQMAHRAPEAAFFGPLRMDDWRLVFRGVADIEAAPGCHVEGGLWRITGADEHALDRYEGVKGGLYVKDYFTVGYTNAAGERVSERCLVYLMARDRGQAAPSKSYLDSIRRGYEDFGLDPTTLQQAVEAAEAAEEIIRAERAKEAKEWAARYYRPKSHRAWDGAYGDGPQDDDDWVRRYWGLD